MKLNKLFILTGSLLLGSLLVSFASCNVVPCSVQTCSPTPCPAPCGPCAPFGSECKPYAVIDCCDYRFEKFAPNSVAVGCPFDYCYRFESKIDAIDIKLSDALPEGSEYISSSPQAVVSGNTLRWEFDKMEPGCVQELRVTVRPTCVGCLRDCMKVTVVPYACTVVCVGQPMLQICKSGPDQICVCECANFNIQVSNCGNFMAQDVVITDIVPDGMRHVSGKKELKLAVGNLAPGESTMATLQLTPERGGCFCNVARATSCDGRVVEAKACVNVLVPRVAIAKTGPCMQYLTKCAEYTINVKNNGDTPLENLMVTDYIPPCTCLVDAPGATVQNGIASWCIPCLGCGESACFNLVLTADCPAVATNKACVQGCYCGCDLCECAEVVTEWRGHPALLIEVVDICDPILCGEATRYCIKVINQGTAADENVQITAILPPELDYVCAEGPTAFNGSQKMVSFDPVPCLRPGESVQYMVKVRAVQKGDARFRVEMRSNMLRSPVVEEEATQVF